MARRCVFCGHQGNLTLEHVFPDWLHTIGINTEPVKLVAGPLNRLGREQTPPTPYSTQVRDVCRSCNEGWMKRLEDLAAVLLPPWIRGEPTPIAAEAAPGIARWLQKTALVSLLVSAAGGVGVPIAEYHLLYDQRDEGRPLPASDVWIGRYDGSDRSPFMWVTPLVVMVDGLEQPDWPQGYASTLVLGRLLLHGVRLTTSFLELDFRSPLGLSPIWPMANDEITSSSSVNERDLLDLASGKIVGVANPHLQVRPWKPATELAQSELIGSMIELPLACGKHAAYYPSVLAAEGMAGHSASFMTSCGCGLAYVVETALDGAHSKAAGSPREISDLYQSLSGDEYSIADENGLFFYKRDPDSRAERNSD
jgi:hypothetical protein